MTDHDDKKLCFIPRNNMLIVGTKVDGLLIA